MTKQDERPTIREVEALFRGREVIVEIHPRFLTVRAKGTRDSASLDWESVADILFMRQAKLIAGDVPKMKGRR